MEGLLWFDDSKRSLADKVAEAAERYRQKFEAAPQVCLVNPVDFSLHFGGNGNGRKEAAGVRVLPSQSILPHHLLIGAPRRMPEAE